jgi:mRNA interferase MazF
MASVDDLWLVDFGEPHPSEPARYRPALILGPPDTFGPRFPYAIVAPLTSVHRRLSLHVEVEATADTGLDETSYIQCELVRSVNHKRLVHRLGVVGPDIGHAARTILRTLLGH